MTPLKLLAMCMMILHLRTQELHSQSLISLSLLVRIHGYGVTNVKCIFEVCAVHPALKTRFAALNFIAPASTWLQTMERRGRIIDWAKLCELVFAKYDKDQQALMLRHLEALKQTSLVT